MPLQTFRCQDCGTEFAVAAGDIEDPDDLSCPSCGSEDLDDESASTNLDDEEPSQVRRRSSGRNPSRRHR